MVRPGPNLRQEPALEIGNQPPREQPVALAIDDVRPDRNDGEAAARCLLLNELLGGPFAAGVEVFRGKRPQGVVLGNSLFAGPVHGGAAVHGDRRDVNEACTGTAGCLEREPSAADIDAREFLERIVRRNERGGVNDCANARGSPLPCHHIGDVPHDRLGAKGLDRGDGVLAYQRPRSFTARPQRVEHVCADEPGRAGDEHGHAGATRGASKGSPTTRASRPAARTVAPSGTSRRTMARPIQRPSTDPPPSGSQAMLVTRPTSRSSWVTALQPLAGVAGGAGSDSRPRRCRFGCPRKCRRLTVSWPGYQPFVYDTPPRSSQR